MLVERARRVARRWVLAEGVALPGFQGAVLAGSALWARPDAGHPATSDVDVMVVVDPAVPTPSLGKLRYEGVLLDVSVAPMPGSAHDVLSDYHLAGTFHLPGVLADPTGRLTEIHRAVSRDFAERPWVLARCTQAMDRVRGWINGMDGSAPLPAQVTSWLFGTGVTTHVLLVAGLRNPTVRGRYAAVRDLLAEHGRLDVHESLLDLLGCAGLGAARVERHLAALEEAFDAAASVRAPSYRFDSDVTALARPIAIDGTRELIARGWHREAVFWLAATYARCLTKLAAAGRPARHEEGLRELLADLGAETYEDRRHRGARVLAFLPTLWQTATTLR
ncbi:hypothetical protein E1286_33735 [Nonomuraea terrae]|uniref:Nucleotidyltransferase domain-containing protein n=1 Tax=Nonomuraea terrae TaxID=2530383 RepID=A0A4R4YAU6_9ACTN|nr:hypothetical protein [Nonomuraea terrae]TDD40889.1 hypothetical protein E1286_33735 [Nonomuraea terrae]